MHFFTPHKNGWIAKTLVASAYENYNIDKAFDIVESYENHTKVNGSFHQKRKEQDKYWLHETIAETLMSNFYSAERLVKAIAEVEEDVVEGRISSFEGAEKLMKIYTDE